MNQQPSQHRLLADWREVQRALRSGELLNVVAAPLEDDLAEWHANIRVPLDDEHPLAGIILHLIIRFPAAYPSAPPAVELCTNVPHANVFPKTRMVHEQQAHRMQDFFELCIDMLGNCSALWQAPQNAAGGGGHGVAPAPQPFTGWSSAYSALSVLLQLEALLLDEEMLYAQNGTNVTEALQFARDFCCAASGHTYDAPWPPFNGDAAATTAIPNEGGDDGGEEQQKLAVRPPRVIPFEFEYTVHARRKAAALTKSRAAAKATAAAKAAAAVPATAPSNTTITTAAVANQDAPTLVPAPLPLQQQKQHCRSKFDVGVWIKSPTLARHGLRGAAAAAAVAAALARRGVVEESDIALLLRDGGRGLRQALPSGKGRHNLARWRGAVAAAFAERMEQWRQEVLLQGGKGGRGGGRGTALPGRAEVALTRGAPAGTSATSVACRSGGGDGWVSVTPGSKLAAPARTALTAVRGPSSDAAASDENNAFAMLAPPLRPLAVPGSVRQLREQLSDSAKLSTAQQNNLRRALKRAQKREGAAAAAAADAAAMAIASAATASATVEAAAAAVAAAAAECTAVTTPADDSCCWKPAGLFGTCGFNALVSIFSFLAPHGVAAVGAGCRFLHDACVDGRLWRELFSSRYPRSALSAAAMCDWRRVYQLENAHLYARLRCFHTKIPATLHDDGRSSGSGATILGIPISITTNPRTGEIDYMHSTFDLLSHEAFAKRGVRATVWNETFTHWLPLYLTEGHFNAAVREGVLQRALARLCPYEVDAEGCKVDADRCGQTAARDDGNWRKKKQVQQQQQQQQQQQRGRARLGGRGVFHPGMALHVLPKLLNTCVVLLSDRGMHASDAAVEGYCLIHRLLVGLMHRYPTLQRAVAQRVTRFLSSEAARGKDKVRAMGEFVPLLAVCNEVPWATAVLPIVQECFDRNVIWACKKFPELATDGSISTPPTATETADTAAADAVAQAAPTADPAVDERRLALTLEATRVGRRLLMFHAVFVARLARPQGRLVEAAALALDYTFGVPPEWQKRELRATVRTILDDAADSWPAYFRAVGVPCPSKRGLSLVLQRAVRNSLRRGYHKANMDFSRIHRSGVSKILLKGESYSASPNLRRVRMQEVWHYVGARTLFLDASVLLYGFDGEFQGVVDYSNLRCDHSLGRITHSGDQIDHQRCEGVHSIELNLASLKHTQALFFTMSAWEDAKLRDIKQPFVRMHDEATGHELCRYNFHEGRQAAAHYGDAKCVIMCKIYREEAGECWQVKAIGELCDGAANDYGPIKAAIAQLSNAPAQAKLAVPTTCNNLDPAPTGA